MKDNVWVEVITGGQSGVKVKILDDGFDGATPTGFIRRQELDWDAGAINSPTTCSGFAF